ncbi:MAG: response regulator transcription factor [Sedimentisphaerales bacterium]|nr:response regulator transcription factor [Sedimentisphaerales bacterium]
MLGLFKLKKKTDQVRILIVEDDADLTDTIKRRLESCGWEVTHAPNGRDGLEMALSQHPDLILLDTSMPVMNGHEMLQRLRRESNTKTTPVIMCTRHSDVQDIATASAYNISDYVTKPFDCTELIERIESALTAAG